MDSRISLERKVNTKVENGLSKPAVRDALKLIQENFTAKNKQDTRNRAITALVEGGFLVREPMGPRIISPKKILQASWKLANKLKPLDFTVHAVGRNSQGDGDMSAAAAMVPTESWERLVGDGIATVLKKGQYDSSFRDKGGVFQNMLLYGDGFRLIGPWTEKNLPIRFTSIVNSNIYVNVNATAFRRGSNPVTKCAVVFSGTWGEFCRLFPDYADKAGLGQIPRDMGQLKETDQTYTQRMQSDSKLIEWCYYFDIENKNMTLFAGQQCTILQQHDGKDYPYVIEDEDGNEEPYIPVSQYMMWPAAEGFYNHGLGDLLYEYCVYYSRIFNQMAGYINENTFPIEIVNVPQGESGKFFAALEGAYEQRSLGRRAFLPLETSPTDPKQIGSRPFTAGGGMINEAMMMFDRIDLEIKRLGIHFDEQQAANATATQILADSENADQFAQQIMEYNASETEFELDASLNAIKSFVKTSNKTVLNITTPLRLNNGEELSVKRITLGAVADEVRKNKYFFKVNSRTGSIPSNVVRRARLMNTLSLLPPESPQQIQIAKQIAQLDDVNLSFDAPEQQPAEPMPPPTPPSALPPEIAPSQPPNQLNPNTPIQ